MSDDKQKENPPQATNDDSLKPAGELTEKDMKEVAGGAPIGATNNLLLKVDGIEGESIKTGTEGWIEIL